MEYAEGETMSQVLKSKGTLEEAELKARHYPILDGLEVTRPADSLHRKGNPFATFAREGVITDDRSRHRRDVVGWHVSTKSRWRWIVGALYMCAVLFGGAFSQEEPRGHLRPLPYASSARQAADRPLLSGWLGGLSTVRSKAEAAEATGQRTEGTVFRDCEECPQMVVLPSGSFMMGSPDGEEGRQEVESPRHLVTIGYRLAVGVYEVTFDEWDACVSAGGCGGYVPEDESWGRGERPVINVSWKDAQSYVSWLSKRTGESYRLLSESEWEYAARAGTTTRYSWGDEIGANRANCVGCGSRWDKNSDTRRTAPVGWFAANAWGLYDMHGNVWEWVQDCWNDHYLRAPADGSAWERGRCSVRVLRGGSWFSVPGNLRSAYRDGNTSGVRNGYYGFRIARTLTP